MLTHSTNIITTKLQSSHSKFQIYCNQSFQVDAERDQRPGRAARGDRGEPEHGRGVRPLHPSKVYEG